MSRGYDGRSTEYQGEPPTWGDDEGESGGGARAGGAAAPAAKPTSGNARLALAAGLTARPGSPQSVTRWQGERAVPLVVIVNVASNVANSAANPYASEASFLAQCSGNAQGGGAELGGVLRLTYGLEQTTRVLEADLQSGSYQLPPVDSCNVDAYLFLNGPAQAVVTASVVPGRHPSPTRLRASFRSLVPNGGTVVEKVPYGARWVSLCGGGATALGSGPKLALYQGAAGPLIYQDYSAPSFLGSPGQAVELAGRDDITIANLGAAPADITVRFYLEA